jgi:hypothetical protein
MGIMGWENGGGHPATEEVNPTGASERAETVGFERVRAEQRLRMSDYPAKMKVWQGIITAVRESELD